MIHFSDKNGTYTSSFPIALLYIFLAGNILIGSSIEAHAGETLATESFRTVESMYDDGYIPKSKESDNKENYTVINSDNQEVAVDTSNESDAEVGKQGEFDTSVEETKTSFDNTKQSPRDSTVNTTPNRIEDAVNSDGSTDTKVDTNPVKEESVVGKLNPDTSLTTNIADAQSTFSAVDVGGTSKVVQAAQKDVQETGDESANLGENEIVNTQGNDTESYDSLLSDLSKVSEGSQSEGVSEPKADNISNAIQSDSKDQIFNESNIKDSDEKNTTEKISEEDHLSEEKASEIEDAENASNLNQPFVQQSENNSETTANYVTPQDFGAKGDNENDDTDAINQAIGSLSTEHDTLYIPDGSYRVNTIQKINLRSDIKVILGSNAKLIAIPNGEKSYCILSLRGLNNVSISGGQLYGDRYEHQGSEGEWGHGIGIFDSTDIVLDGIKIFNCWGDGIYLGSDHEWTQDAGCSNIIIRNCELAGNRRNDLSIVSADYVTLKNCIFRDANGTDPQFGVDIETNYESNPNQHIYIDNCTFYGNAKGSVLINSAANDVQISNSVLNGNFINYAGTDVVLSNTTVNGDAYCRKGITLKDNSIINGRGNTNDVAVVDYSAANAAPLHSYRQDSSNRISSWFASDTNSPSGSYIGIVRTGWGTHDAGITLRLAELSGGRFGKMIPGRIYRIQYTVMGTGAWGYISNQTGWYPILPQGEAYSTGIVTYLAGDTADGTLSFYATGLNDGMWLRIANIQVLDEDYSGMSQQNDGTWVYSENGNVDTQYTGMASNENGWWYFQDGELDQNYTGMASNEYGWWYYQDGKLDWHYTGMALNQYGWWYYRDGRLDWTYTGEGENDAGIWYYKNGHVAWGLTGMVLTNKEWRYVRDGRIDADYTGMADNQYGWWYFRNGKLDWHYTGMALNQYGWWYYRNGRLDWTYTGEGENDAGTWYYKNGHVAWGLTGMVLTEKGWRFVQNGRIITDYTGIAENQYVDFQIINSRPD